MANQLPVTIDFGALPNTGQGYTPQEFADRLSLNGQIFTSQDFALFTTGATAPTSDTGPWAKDGNTWYYWDSVTGTYIPFIIEQSSLGYWIGSVAPDPTVYNFWIETTAGGSPLALKTYYAAAWVDVYATFIAALIANYSTTTQMNTAIAAAVAPYLLSATAASTYQTIAGMSSYLTTAAAASTYLTQANAASTYLTQANAASTYVTQASNVIGDAMFKGYVLAPGQTVILTVPGTVTGVVENNTIDFDPDSAFNVATYTFTAPSSGYYTFQAEAYVGTSGFTPGDTLDTKFYFMLNNTPSDDFNNEDYSGLGGRAQVGATSFYLTAGNTLIDVFVRYYIANEIHVICWMNGNHFISAHGTQ